MTISFAAAHDQLNLYIEDAALTRCDHCLNEVTDVTQYDTEALHWIRLARLGLHSLDLHALKDRVLHEAATGLEDAPAYRQ